MEGGAYNVLTLLHHILSLVPATVTTIQHRFYCFLLQHSAPPRRYATGKLLVTHYTQKNVPCTSGYCTIIKLNIFMNGPNSTQQHACSLYTLSYHPCNTYMSILHLRLEAGNLRQQLIILPLHVGYLIWWSTQDNAVLLD